ncbi:MAG: DUF4139 domain-containing protein [Planctomycetes bacterium]|nr:DUF4139 domain-containing protein [Planctomycetota bacterium]
MKVTSRNSYAVVGAGLLIVSLYGISHSAAAEPPATPGKVTRVVLYRGQALVTREVAVEGAAGAQEVVVSDLPEQVLPESLYAEGSEAIEVRAVRFRGRAVGEEPREEVRKIEKAIQEAGDKILANKKNTELAGRQTAYLDQLETFIAPTAKTDLAKGVLDAEALEQITKFSFTQRGDVSTRQLALAREARELQEQLALLERKREELTSGSTRTVREAVLFLARRVPGKGTVALNYLVGGCGWSPAYTLRSGADRGQVDMLYSALIQQMSGEAWDNVALTLSTASPTLSAARPGLAPFHVALAPAGRGAVPPNGLLPDVAGRYQGYQSTKSSAVRQLQQQTTLEGNVGDAWNVNVAAGNIQCLELAAGRDVLRMLQEEEPGAPSIGYKIDTPVSMASRSDQQVVRILQAKLPSDFYYVATPLLTSYVFREASLANVSPEDLLAGPITVYLDGRFVGRSEIPTVARGQKFVVGFGAEPQLRARRELADKSDQVQGGNRELNLQYRLVLENYGDKGATVRVFDRLPHSERPTDARVTMGEMKDKISDDKLYLRLERPKGILRWDVEVPAHAAGDTARMVTYGYRVEFDRNFALTAPMLAGPQQGPGAPADSSDFQKQFNELEKSRGKY